MTCQGILFAETTARLAAFGRFMHQRPDVSDSYKRLSAAHTAAISAAVELPCVSRHASRALSSSIDHGPVLVCASIVVTSCYGVFLYSGDDAILERLDARATQAHHQNHWLYHTML